MAYLPAFPARDELLTIAFLELARERGVHDMSIRTLAAAVRAAPGSLTYHHGDKAALLARCASYLGGWLCRDAEDRVSRGGPPAFLPDPGSEDSEELEYCNRLRAWAQLRAYGLHSSAVGASVDAGDAQLLRMLASTRPDSAGDGEAATLALWASLTALSTALLRPGADLTQAWAGAAVTLLVESEASR